MRSRYRVSLAGVQLDTINDNLLILDVSHDPVDFSDTTYTIAGQDGYDLSGSRLLSRTVTVSFELHIYDIVKRQAACQDVITWAKDGGYLVVNDRTGQRLTVRCKNYPAIESVRDWTAPLQVVFETTAVPYWEETTATAKSVSGTNTYGAVKVPGNAGDACVGVTVTATAKITTLQLEVRTQNSSGSWASKSLLSLTGLSIPKNGTVTISYTGKRFLKIRDQDNKSLLANVASASTDRLTATCGVVNRFYIKANAKVTASFTVRGLWL